MYSIAHRWSSTFTQRDGEPAAIISSAELKDRWTWRGRTAQSNVARDDLGARMRRVLLKDLAMLYWHLPVNNDSSSLLHQPEDPDLPTEDIYESDLNPAQTRWGQFEGEPCLYFRYSAKTGLQMLPGQPIRTCSNIPGAHEGESAELFEVDLRLGTMVDRRNQACFPDEFTTIRMEIAGAVNAFHFHNTLENPCLAEKIKQLREHFAAQQ